MQGVVTRLAGGGSAGGVVVGSSDGTGSAAMFKNPHGVAVSSSETVYVADIDNHLVRMISPTGTIVSAKIILCASLILYALFRNCIW